MILRTSILTVMVLVGASVALAHSGVTNPAVIARMETMKGMQDGTKILGGMLKGTVAFDAEVARSALRDISRHARDTPELFATKETDPKSEALPIIWEDFDDFVVKSNNLETLADGLAQTLTTEDALQPALAQLGAACKACHARFRE